MLFLAAAHTIEGALDDERGEVLTVDLGEDDVDVGESTVGNPHLLAVEHIAAVILTRRAGLGAERIRPRARFAQTIRTNQFPAHELREILLFLRIGAEHSDRHDDQTGLRTERGAKRATLTNPTGDDGRAHLVQREPAIGLRNVGPHQTQLTSTPEQLAREVPILGLKLIVGPHDLVRHELLGRLVDESMLLRLLLRREHSVARCVCQEPGAAFLCGRSRCRRHLSCLRLPPN